MLIKHSCFFASPRCRIISCKSTKAKSKVEKILSTFPLPVVKLKALICQVLISLIIFLTA